MKAPSLFLIFTVSLAICACENQWMASILQPKTITFDSNGGSPVPSQTVLKNEKISRPRDPVRPDYQFRNWYTDNVTFQNIWNFNDSPEGDMILFAAWSDTSGSTRMDPTADDFYIEGTGTFNYDGNPKEVTITPKPGKTRGEIIVNYFGINGTKYIKTFVAPFEPGTYRVTFVVYESDGWNGASELEAGTLVIKISTGNEFASYMSYLNYAIIANAPTSSITIPLSISSTSELTEIKNALNNSSIYITLDFSGSSITEIPEMAFTTFFGNNSEINDPSKYTKCKTLAGIILPDGVTSIGDYAFFCCTNLTSVTIPNSVTSIGERAFGACTSLTSVTIPNSVISIGQEAFGGSGITSITIPNNVTSIGEWAFAGCESLTSVTIGNSVTSIEVGAFASCTSLTRITIPANVTSIGDLAFSDCSSLTSVTIGNSVTSIEEGAFAYCTSLTNITIPASVTSIGRGVFEFCKSLTSVTFNGTIDASGFNTNAFDGLGDLREKYLGLTGTAGEYGPGTYTRNITSTTWTKQ